MDDEDATGSENSCQFVEQSSLVADVDTDIEHPRLGEVVLLERKRGGVCDAVIDTVALAGQLRELRGDVDAFCDDVDPGHAAA